MTEIKISAFLAFVDQEPQSSGNLINGNQKPILFQNYSVSGSCNYENAYNDIRLLL